jgi:hypothetical protein
MFSLQDLMPGKGAMAGMEVPEDPDGKGAASRRYLSAVSVAKRLRDLRLIFVRSSVLDR